MDPPGEFSFLVFQLSHTRCNGLLHCLKLLLLLLIPLLVGQDQAAVLLNLSLQLVDVLHVVEMGFHSLLHVGQVGLQDLVPSLLALVQLLNGLQLTPVNTTFRLIRIKIGLLRRWHLAVLVDSRLPRLDLAAEAD